MRLKKIISEWNDQSFKGIPKRWSKPYGQKGTDLENKTLSEGKFKQGDIVVPSVGPHKGVKHTIIYDFGNGRYNIQPMGLRPNKIQYALGAAGASEDQLKKVADGPQKPAPSIIDTSDLKPGQSPFEKTKDSMDSFFKSGKYVNEAPMDDRFAKEYEVSTKAFINHIKHELSSAEGADKSVLKKMLQNLMTVSGYPKLMGRMTGMKESKTMKLKDLLNEAPTIQKSKVDYSTMDLKSNINLKWRSYDDMISDLEQWIEVSKDGMGDAQIRVMARELKELSMKYIGYKSADFDKPDFSDW